MSVASVLASLSGLPLPQAAARFAAAGVPVFPCVPGEKRPLTRHGFHEASVDLAQVVAWWHRWPSANIGVPTGTASGVDVVDVDRKPDGNGFDAFGRARRAGLVEGWVAVVRTPSGGAHFYYPADPGRSRPSWQAAAARVDFRGTGGYVIVPPSAVMTVHGPAGYSLTAHGNREPRPVDAAARGTSSIRVPSPSCIGRGALFVRRTRSGWPTGWACARRANATVACSGPPAASRRRGCLCRRWSMRSPRRVSGSGCRRGRSSRRSAPPTAPPTSNPHHPAWYGTMICGACRVLQGRCSHEPAGAGTCAVAGWPGGGGDGGRRDGVHRCRCVLALLHRSGGPCPPLRDRCGAGVGVAADRGRDHRRRNRCRRRARSATVGLVSVGAARRGCAGVGDGERDPCRRRRRCRCARGAGGVGGGGAAAGAACDHAPHRHPHPTGLRGRQATSRRRGRADAGERSVRAQAVIPTPGSEQTPAREVAGRLRDEEGWSNKAIARHLGVHPSTVGRWFARPELTTRDEQETP